jgi:V8-like Glu-specific endopeptidase
MDFWDEHILEEKDRRIAVSKHDLLNFPHNCIGRISVTKKGTKGVINGTGCLISSCLVLTAAHNFQGLSEKMKR